MRANNSLNPINNMFSAVHKLISLFSLSLFIALFAYPMATYAQDIRSFIFHDIQFDNAEYTQQLSQFYTQIQSENHNQARLIAVDLVEKISEDLSVDKLSFAMLKSNAAIAIAITGDQSTAISEIESALEILESGGRYNLRLVNILMAQAYLYRSQEEYDKAENALRRSQHIFHRQAGVYAEGQLPIIEVLTDMDLERGQTLNADKGQYFRLKIAEEVYGSNSEEIIPTLQSLGLYFANRASVIAANQQMEQAIYRDKLFKDAVSLFERSIAIIEDKYDVNDLRLIEPLRGLSKTRFMQGSSFNNARVSMERATNIISSNPSTDISDHAKSLVALGDTYLITHDSRSLGTYSQAWAVLEEVPDNEVIRQKLFGEPKLLYPDVLVRPILTRQPTNTMPQDELFVNLEYDVRMDGKVRNVQVIDGNVPNNQKKLLRDYVSKMRYRPRLIDGQSATTEGIKLHQTFRVVRKSSTVNRGIATRQRLEIDTRPIEQAEPEALPVLENP